MGTHRLVNKPEEADHGAEPASAPDAGRVLVDAPWQLAAGAVLWLSFGIFALVSGVTSAELIGIDPARAVRVSGELVSPTAAGQPVNVLAILAGVAMFVLVPTLAAGKGWSRNGLVIVGVLAVLALRAEQHWQVALAMILLVLGTIPLLSASLHRYLSVARAPAEQAPTSP